MAKVQGKRFVILQEPGPNEEINIGFMKEITGGDTIQARGLYSEPTEYKPQFKIVLTCNKLPSVPGDDNGTWRRLRVVEFTSKFVNNPDPTKKNEFKIDKYLYEKLPKWKETFISLLIDRYKIFKRNNYNISEPNDVCECTLKYRNKNDVYSEFIYECIEEDNNSTLKLNEVFTFFKTWYRESYNTMRKCPNRNDIKEYFNKKYGDYNKGWKGLKINDEEMLL